MSVLDGRWRAPLVLDETGSTNDDIVALAHQRPPGPGEWLLVTARHQRAGRGRQGRVWLDEPGGSALFSVATRLALPARHWPAASLIVGEAVARALDPAGERIGLRWPNDLLLDDAPWAKVGGVLCERVSLPVGALWVAGVGINLRVPRDPRLAAAAAVQLDAQTDLVPRLAAAIAEAVDAWQMRGGRLLTAPLDARLLFRDVEVGLDMGDGSRQAAWLLGIDERGALRVRDVVDGGPSGPERRVVPLRLLDACTDPPWHHPPALGTTPPETPRPRD